MGKKLAIKGHPTRGKEVIELFKMMGGCECGYCGGGTGFYYYISQFVSSYYHTPRYHLYFPSL